MQSKMRSSGENAAQRPFGFADYIVFKRVMFTAKEYTQQNACGQKCKGDERCIRKHGQTIVVACFDGNLSAEIENGKRERDKDQRIEAPAEDFGFAETQTFIADELRKYTDDGGKKKQTDDSHEILLYLVEKMQINTNTFYQSMCGNTSLDMMKKKKDRLFAGLSHWRTRCVFGIRFLWT